MSRLQYICLTTAMAIAAMAVACMPGSQRPYRKIAHDLVTKSNSKDILFLGATFSNSLTMFLSSPSEVEKIEMGDAPPPRGDGNADARLFLKNERNERLAIRLKRDASDPDKFHILGFWLAQSGE